MGRPSNPPLGKTLTIIHLIFSGRPILHFFTTKVLHKIFPQRYLAIISSFLSWRRYFHAWIVNWIKNLFSNWDRNMCSVLIKFLFTLFINLIFKYVYFEIEPIILDLLIMVNCPHHENLCIYPMNFDCHQQKKKWGAIQFARIICFMKNI